ncbi:MAG: hypothetical protein SFW66_00925 [Gammaproteobacteria bacterium]|nr:hypothetical protein [Gammaproteobacteria bacterium]
MNFEDNELSEEEAVDWSSDDQEDDQGNETIDPLEEILLDYAGVSREEYQACLNNSAIMQCLQLVFLSWNDIQNPYRDSRNRLLFECICQHSQQIFFILMVFRQYHVLSLEICDNLCKKINYLENIYDLIIDLHQTNFFLIDVKEKLPDLITHAEHISLTAVTLLNKDNLGKFINPLIVSHLNQIDSLQKAFFQLQQCQILNETNAAFLLDHPENAEDLASLLIFISQHFPELYKSEKFYQWDDVNARAAKNIDHIQRGIDFLKRNGCAYPNCCLALYHDSKNAVVLSEQLVALLYDKNLSSDVRQSLLSYFPLYANEFCACYRLLKEENLVSDQLITIFLEYAGRELIPTAENFSHRCRAMIGMLQDPVLSNQRETLFQLSSSLMQHFCHEFYTPIKNIGQVFEIFLEKGLALYAKDASVKGALLLDKIFVLANSNLTEFQHISTLLRYADNPEGIADLIFIFNRSPHLELTDRICEARVRMNSEEKGKHAYTLFNSLKGNSWFTQVHATYLYEHFEEISELSMESLTQDFFEIRLKQEVYFARRAYFEYGYAQNNFFRRSDFECHLGEMMASFVNHSLKSRI